MSECDYVSLAGSDADAIGPSLLTRPSRVFAGVGGVALLLLAALSSRLQHGWLWAEKKSKKDFVPLQGMNRVLAWPYVPGPLQTAASVSSSSDSSSCLFLYGVLRAHAESDGKFEAGTVYEQEGWVYGASLSGQQTLAQPSGSPFHVVQGKLLCWPRKQFGAKLDCADKYWYCVYVLLYCNYCIIMYCTASIGIA
eukprot:g42695.t1